MKPDRVLVVLLAGRLEETIRGDDAVLEIAPVARRFRAQVDHAPRTEVRPSLGSREPRRLVVIPVRDDAGLPEADVVPRELDLLRPRVDLGAEFFDDLARVMRVRGVPAADGPSAALRSPVRVAVTPDTDQRIADTLGVLLPTDRIDDLAHAQAAVRLNPHTQYPVTATTAAMLPHHAATEVERGARGPSVHDRLRRRKKLTSSSSSIHCLSNW
jgi:hypothetical protein